VIVGEVNVSGDTNGIPLMGLGTFGRTGLEGLGVICAAIDIGYRHIDTAQIYDTEANVGKAIAESGIAREEFVITTKVTFSNFSRNAFRPSLARSLDQLAVDRVDLTLLHWPSPGNTVPLNVYLDELARAKADGLTRMIGVSNFTISLLEKAELLLGIGEIATNQVEVHPFFQNSKLADWCQRHGIVVTAYVPLAKGKVTGDPTLREIADRHGAAPTQIALAWTIQRGIAVIPASGKVDRAKSNFESSRVRLSESEVKRIDNLDRGLRLINPDFSPEWDKE
jgi:2,5-diketo-D-gluconate reductase B